MKFIKCFDFDGTITNTEVLPCIASELGISEEIDLLTKLTMEGVIPFEKSFKLRTLILSRIPISKVNEIVSEIPLNKTIVDYIRDNNESCAIVTGNIDEWIRPVLDTLKCRVFSSTAYVKSDELISIKKIIQKGQVIKDLKLQGYSAISIGDGANDVPMFRESEIAIAYGGVHLPFQKAIEESDYVVNSGEALCRLLKMLS